MHTHELLHMLLFISMGLASRPATVKAIKGNENDYDNTNSVL